jgi:transcriptional regulator with XRE-family HTH domain
MPSGPRAIILRVVMPAPSEVIHQMRIERGLSQAGACAKVGLPRATWSAVESGASTRPRLQTRVRIARALGVLPSSIWGLGPKPLHLEDYEDPRWEAAVLRLARRVDRQGTPQERRRLAVRLLPVLELAEPDTSDAGSTRSPHEELWSLCTSLMLERGRARLEIVGGRLVERGLGGRTMSTGLRASARRRAGDHNGRPTRPAA